MYTCRRHTGVSPNLLQEAVQLRVGGGVHGDLKQGLKEVVQELSKAVQLTSGLVDVTGVMRFIHTCTYKAKMTMQYKYIHWSREYVSVHVCASKRAYVSVCVCVCVCAPRPTLPTGPTQLHCAHIRKFSVQSVGTCSHRGLT